MQEIQEIVVHHNDLNQLILPDFKEQEYNVFANMIFKLKNKGNEVLEFSASEISKWFGKAYSFESLAWMLDNMAESMRKKGFVHISQVGKITSKAHITMFPTFIINTEPSKFKNDPMLKNTLKSLKVRVNKDFLYLFNELKSNFTEYELEEFVDLEGKYTKRLYMLLKQYKDTGKCLVYKNRWDDFCKLLNIPDDYRQINIDTRILKPAIRALSKERNLFSGDRVVFENLTYEKIKSGRGGKVAGIIFTFKPQKKEPKKLKEPASSNSDTSIDRKLVDKIDELKEIYRYEKYVENKHLITIQNIRLDSLNHKDIYVDLDNGFSGQTFQTIQELEKFIDTRQWTEESRKSICQALNE